MRIAGGTYPIRSREDFVAFVIALRKDLQESPATWENSSLEAFLESLAAWVDNMDGYYASQGESVPGQLTWQVAADMLMAAKVYE